MNVLDHAPFWVIVGCTSAALFVAVREENRRRDEKGDSDG